jgi:DNA-binding CsgD family transcriptional regulator
MKVIFMFQNKILELLDAKTTSEAVDIFSKISKYAGARYFSIIGVPKKGKLSFKNFYSSCPKEWIKHYHKEGFLEKDPVIIKGFLDPSKLTYLWKASDPKSQFMKKCKDFNTHYRLAFFVRSHTWHSAVIFSFKESCEEILTSPAQIGHFEILSSLLASKIYAKTEPFLALSLTDREFECLRWTSEGKTAEEVGLILSISHWTVTFHLKNVCKKLGVYNKTAAILKATKLGLL